MKVFTNPSSETESTDPSAKNLTSTENCSSLYSAATTQLIVDDFSTPCKPGQVIGSSSPSGHLRQGIDVENILSIDNGALRIQPPITPGWARAGIAYGPYQRQAGLALAIFMLNGHNTSEGNSIEESLKGRLFRWVRGSEANSIGNRLWRWAISSQHRSNARQFYRWIRNHRNRFKKDAHIKENLALGWFSSSVPTDPTAEGNAIVIRASGPENGELCTCCENRLSPVFQGLQNLQTYYVVLLREQGAAYYAASIAQAHGLPAFPHMRLVGIDTSVCDDKIYAGLYQSSLGQVGFRVDTRVYDLQIAVLPALSNWYGTAQTADNLTASKAEPLVEGAIAQCGGSWQIVQGDLQKTQRGLVARSPNSLALLKTPSPAGVVHVIITPGLQTPACALLWRTQDQANTWGLFFEHEQCELKHQTDGEWALIATEKRYGIKANNASLAQHCQPSAVQILDDGQTFSLYLNGQRLFDRCFSDSRLQQAAGVGIWIFNGSDTAFSQIESHPRNIPIPTELKLGLPWQAQGSKIVVSDSFSGSPQALAGHRPDIGDPQWEKTIGRGQMSLTGNKAVKIEASAQQPNPGRLAYTLPWSHPELADVSVDILLPGTARQQGEKGRGGIIFWQDPDNYITISHWLDDTYGGASISSFFHLDGFEEIYDAVWTNVGKRVSWGKQSRLRVTFNGLHFITYADGEPVLYRALTDVYPKTPRLSIRRVGLVANWEWGNDTGSSFSRFIAKA